MSDPITITGEPRSADTLDILEPETDEKYFLSEYTIDRLMSYKDSEIITE